MSGANLSASPKRGALAVARDMDENDAGSPRPWRGARKIGSAKASKPSATEDSVSEPPWQLAIARLRSVTM